MCITDLDSTILTYKGLMTFKIQKSLLSILEHKTTHINTTHNPDYQVISIFKFLANFIQVFGKNVNAKSTENYPYGEITINHNKIQSYNVNFKSIITDYEKNKLEDILQSINNTNNTNTHTVILASIVKLLKSNDLNNYSFTQINQNKYYFNLNIFL